MEAKKSGTRRTNSQLDSDVMRELEELVKQYGFGNIDLTMLLQQAHVGANVFYRRYGSMQQLYYTLASHYDFWINDTVKISDLNILGPKQFFAHTLKSLYKGLSDNTIMQKLLLWEMSEDNATTRRTAQMRDTMNLNLIQYYDLMFKPANINIRSIIAVLMSGIYYLILHRERAEFCSINFNSTEGEKMLSEAIDTLADVIFDKLDQFNEKRGAVARMLDDGIGKSKICKYMNITDAELRSLTK